MKEYDYGTVTVLGFVDKKNRTPVMPHKEQYRISTACCCEVD
jgi:hypothetical protein